MTRFAGMLDGVWLRMGGSAGRAAGVLFGLLLLTGCAATPKQRGTWTGVVQPVNVVDREGNRYEVAQLRIADAELRTVKKGLRSLMENRAPLYPILVNEQGHVIDVHESFLFGRPVKAKGTLIQLYSMLHPKSLQPLSREESPGKAAPWPAFVLRYESLEELRAVDAGHKLNGARDSGGAAATTRTASEGLVGGEAASVGLLSRSEMRARTREKMLQIHSELIADLVKAGVILRDDTATDEEWREQIREVEQASFFLQQVHRELESLFRAYERELAAAQARAARAMRRAEEDSKR